MKNQLWSILAGLGVSFGIPWLLLIVVPYLRMAGAAPVPYAASDEMGGVLNYPDPQTLRFGESDFGARLFAGEGCAYCHTQVVRPTYAGADLWREGWGGRDAEGLARETRAQDYAGEGYAALGYQRIGPDLANAGYRNRDREWQLRHLYNPRIVSPNSLMPSFKHLFREVLAAGRESGSALKLEGRFAPPEGFVVVPTSKANALVDYVMSRRKDAKLPASLAVPDKDGQGQNETAAGTGGN
jgi:hypothetical protein